MVGVLLVFSFLVLPLLSVVIFSKILKNQLFYGWIIGLAASILGLLLSIKLDIPPSYCVMLVLSLLWVGSVCIKCFLHMKEPHHIRD